MLGDEFRRQLMMDGQFGCMTFVCTKVGGAVGGLVEAGLGWKHVSIMITLVGTHHCAGV